MNKGGIGGGGAGSGPTAAATTAAAQKQKALLQRVDTDISNIVENFNHMVNVSRVKTQLPKSSFLAFHEIFLGPHLFAWN